MTNQKRRMSYDRRILRIYPDLGLIEDPQERMQILRRAYDEDSSLHTGTQIRTFFLVLIGTGLILFAMSRIPPVGVFLRTHDSKVLGGSLGVGWPLVAIISMRLRRPRIREGIRRQLLPSGHPVCLQCGYDLHAQAQPRCPECGASFDRRLVTGNTNAIDEGH